MKTPEYASFADTDRAWTYDTLYDVANRAEILQNEGPNSERFQYVENYIDYINNHMSDDYRITTQVTELPSYRAYASKVSHGTMSVQLYKPDETGAFIPYKCIGRMADFVGDKIVLENDEPFVFNSKYQVAVRPLAHKSIEMINITQGSGDGRGDYILFESRIREVIRQHLLAKRAVNEPYSI